MVASRSSRSATASAVSNATAQRQGPVVPLEADQRASLFAAKARGLVSQHLGLDGSAVAATALPFGAAVRLDDAAWVLLDIDPVRSVGAAMVWSRRDGEKPLHLMIDDPVDAGVVARRASLFADAPMAWVARGRSLAPAQIADPHVPIEPSATAREAAAVLHGAGVDVVIEHGCIRGEIRGLEIARVVTDEAGAARIEVGVGRHDREAFTMVHGTLPTADALASVLASVEAVRRPDAEPHPLRQLAPEGWLRWRLVTEPGLIGLEELRPAESTAPRESVKDSGATIALGRDASGEDVVVACSVGIDLDLIPAAADARLALAPSARLVVVLPRRDLHPATLRLGSMLTRPAQFVTIDGDWRVAGAEQFS